MGNGMKIQDVQLDLEQSLASLKSLTASALPPVLEGLRHLPMGGYEPRVSIRHWNGKQYRRVRRDADASYFDPTYCDVVIEFVPSEDPDDGDGGHGADMAKASADDTGDTGEDDDGGPRGAFDREAAMDQLLDALAEAERTREFVGLTWFRDRYLPARGHDWAGDARNSGPLLRRAIDQRLILTSQVPNPHRPLHPVTAIRVNRRHPRFRSGTAPRGGAFTPIPIRGGAIADTVLGDRR